MMSSWNNTNDDDEKKDEEGALPSILMTSAVTFVETDHCRRRRAQRGVDKKDLQAAKKYGVKRGTHCRPNGNAAAIYTYKDIVYIVDDVTGEGVTCYPVPLKLEPVPISSQMQELIVKANNKVRANVNTWTSNTVIVVDTSGSMKEADVWGTRTRLGAVWVSVALDFIAHRLESGESGPTDVVSIVTLGPQAKVLVREAPCTWALYNEIVDIYNSDNVIPYGHGPYLPSISEAESLLTRNANASCVMALVFLSDGRPSDAAIGKGYAKEEYREFIVRKVERLALKFGRRLTFTAIGIGDQDNFDMLEQMVEAARDYHANSELRLPSKSSASLGDVFTSVASSITTTQTEMTDFATLKQRKVREVARESRKKANVRIYKVSTEDFYIYPLDRVKRHIYKEWFEGRQKQTSYEETSLQHPEARYVALAKGPFGEGAERFAYRFFEVAKDMKTIVGSPMVAKESRLVLEGEEDGVGDERARKKFVRTFCSTQQLARRLATEFNEKLDQTRRVDSKTPRVAFLDCSIYQIDDKNLGKLSVLVEDKLDHNKWHKWNSNNGYVEGMKAVPRFAQERSMDTVPTMDNIDLDMIAEGSEEEDESDGEGPEHRIIPIQFSASDVAQAFSHFTYHATGRKRLVCDLQGVFDESSNLLKFSDPVIHYHNRMRTDRRCVHGRTDRGEKGVRMFFETHHEHHGHLCRLMLRGFRRPVHMQGSTKKA